MPSTEGDAEPGWGLGGSAQSGFGASFRPRCGCYSAGVERSHSGGKGRRPFAGVAASMASASRLRVAGSNFAP